MIIPITITAKNEARAIGRMLDTLRTAIAYARAHEPRLQLEPLVVLDDCADATGAIAEGKGFACVTSSGDTVYYTPSPNAPASQREQITMAERRHRWFRKHMVNKPIYGNMARAPGDSSLAYMHGTDNPQGHLLLDDDQGPSSVHDRATATDQSDQDF